MAKFRGARRARRSQAAATNVPSRQEVAHRPTDEFPDLWAPGLLPVLREELHHLVPFFFEER